MITALKRIISFCMVVVMLCGMMPMTAFATEETQETVCDHTYENGSCIGCEEKDPNKLELNGLNVLCLGDSITAGQGLTTDTRWTNVLASKYGWNLTNKSQGGISLSSYYYTANGKSDVSIAKKAEILKTMTTKPDVIIVWGGHNDTSYRYSPLGTWDDETTDSFKGALKYIAELADEYAPDATLFVLTPLWTTEAPSTLKVPESTTDTNWMFVDAIYEGAEAYGWIPINMDLCGITPFTKSGLLLDNIHPNEAGTEKIVEYLSEELASYGANSKKETVVLNQSSVSLEVGKKTTVKAVLTPRSGYNTPVFIWSSSNTDVATVNSNGVITAVAHGNATITATADNGVSAAVKVSVAEGEHTYESTVTPPTCTEQGYTTYTCACGESYVDEYVDAVRHNFQNGICVDCNRSAMELDYTHAIPQSQGVVNAIARAYQLTDIEWTPVADMPGIKKIDGKFTVITFEAGVTYRGIPYSGVIATDTYVGLNVSLESFLTALENENSVLYTENLFSTNPKSATYFGTVCSKFAQYVLDIPGSYNTNNVANIPGVDTIALPGQYTVDQIKLGDIILHTQDHTAVCTDILYDADGNVAFIEISEAVLPLVRRKLWSPEEFYSHFSGYRLCRYQFINDVPAAPTVPSSDKEYALMPRFGDKYNYTVSSTKGIVDILQAGYSKAVILRDGAVISEIALNGASTFSFDRSVPGYLEMYLEKDDGTRSDSVYACVVKSSVKVTDSSAFLSGRLSVAFEGSSGTPLYVQIGSGQSVFCSVEDSQNGGATISFSSSLVSGETVRVRVAYQNEYGIYLSSWVSFTVDYSAGTGANPSTDPYLSQGTYWDGYNITPSSHLPLIQEGKEGYWTYTMIPVKGNTTYYSYGATRTWFLDANGDPITSINAYKDCTPKCQFTTPDGTAYVSIAYSTTLVEKGNESMMLVSSLPEEDGKEKEEEDTEEIPINPSTDFYLSQGEYWDGYTLTPSKSTPTIQSGKEDYWTYTMVPVEGNTMYYSVGANRMWFFDANKKPISTYNAISDSTIRFQFTTPENARYVSITYAPSVVEKGTETMKKFGPVITQQPESVEQEIGKKFAITVKAEGEGLTYRWYFRHANSNEWCSSLAIGNVYENTMTTDQDGCEVYCVITDVNGHSVTSHTVKVSLIHAHEYHFVLTPPTCTEQGYTTYTCACGDSYVDDYVEATGEHSYENGVCIGCGANAPVTAKPMSMRYDDHVDMTGKVIEIIDAGKPTSYKVGYGVAAGTLDDAVVTLEGDTLVATGIGTALVKIDGQLYEVTVEAAPISLILLAGQSNMRGSEGNADQSIVCPDGMVYATFGDDRGDAAGIMNVNNATNFAASALTGEYSTINVNGTTDNLSYYPIYALTEQGAGTFGPDSGFAYEWVKQTGEKIWIVNAAHGGSSITSWQPGATNFKEAVLLFGACQETLQKEIAAGHYTLSHMGYFWCQGCSDYNWTAEKYVTQYLAMHEGLKSSLAFDHDSNAATDSIVFEFAGIIPVRAGHDYNDGYREGVYADTTDKRFYESFKDLQMTGPRVAQYWMCNNPDLEDIWMVCNVGEDWVWMPDGTNGVSDYFNAHYPNGTVDYTTQVAQKASWYTPTTPAAVHDSIHYNQIGYNEVGRESVRNILVILGEISAPDVTTSVQLLTWDGYTSASQISASLVGKTETLVVPKIYPLWKTKDVIFTLSDGVVWNYYDLLALEESLNGSLTMGNQTVTMTGHNWSEWETIREASADGAGLQQRTCSHCYGVEEREIKGVWQIYDLNAHLLELPDNICHDTNLWAILPHEDVHFTSGQKWGKTSTPTTSITIPVNPGDKIYATSWKKAGENGHETSNGIRVTFFNAEGIAKTMGPGQSDREFYANGGYLIAPEGTIAINIVMWYDSEDYEVYILNREHTYTATVTAPTCTEQGYTTYTCTACGDEYEDDFTEATGHSYQNGICTNCNGSVTEDAAYIPAIPQSQGVVNAIDRAYALTDVEWTPLQDVPGVIKENGEFVNLMFEAGVTYRGIPYSGVIPTDTYVGLNVTLTSFLTALENPNSVLYTENLHSSSYPKAATYFGTVCSKFAQYVLDIPGSFNTNNIANVPGMDTIAMPGAYTVNDIQLGDVVLHTVNHTTVCTGLLYDVDGNVAYVEISEAVLPLTRRMWWSAEEFYEHFDGYRLCRYQYVDDIPAVPATEFADTYALMPRFGDKYNYKVSSTKGVVDILERGYEKAVILRDGVIIETITLNGATSFQFDRSKTGYMEMYLEKADGTKSGSVYACVVNSSIQVMDSASFLSGKLTVSFEGTSGTPLYVQVGSGQAVFCSVEDEQGGQATVAFRASSISGETVRVRVAYQNEYGIYLSSWQSFTVDYNAGTGPNPSTDPYLSQGIYWDGYNITPSNHLPAMQEGKESYWTYTMIPVEENTTYYSWGATRIWYLDATGKAISTYNAYKDSAVPCYFTTPAGSAYVSIAYSPNLLNQGEEKIEKISSDYEGGKDEEEIVPANPSTDPYLSQGEYWDGYTLTPSSSVPIIQADKPNYWTYAMVPVEANTTYYSVGANRMWFFDVDKKPISTYNAITGGEIQFQFTTPENACYVSITYASSVVEKGTECLQKVVPAHTHIYLTAITPPTCTEQGYTTHTCHCGESYVDSYVNALGHSFGAWVTTTKPNCTTAGEERRDCNECEHYETREVKATGHNYNAVVTKPTCTSQGYTTHTCHCGDSYVADFVDALGHTEVVDAAIKENSARPGKTEGSHCATCGQILIAQQEILAKGYDWMLEDGEFKILLIGNSYSQDASNGSHTTDSQLLTILQALLGEDVKITVALLYSGGKGMHWHATQAEQGNTAYSFRVISTDNPKWTSKGSYKSADALAWTDWDVISLQPYNINVGTGEESVPYPEQTDPKFYHISVSSAYMLDHVTRYAPQADIYFYMHWAQTSGTILNAALSNYNKQAAFMPQVLDYTGTESGAQFNTLIPVGLSIQNARTTYLALLRYNTTAYADGNLNLITDAQIGLQRDGGHVSFNIGRYIAALTFAEMIIPEDMRADNYVLPEIRITESVGKLPKEYTEIAQKAVLAAVSSWKQGSLSVTEIEGYLQDPTEEAERILTNAVLDLSCGISTEPIIDRILALLPADFVVDEISLPENIVYGDVFHFTVTVRFGYMSVTCELSGNVTKHEYKSVVTAPTCTEQGYTTHTCHCGESYVDSFVNALGHSFGTWVVTTKPTCTKKGTERRDCDACDHYETREVKALGHDTVKHAAQSATCTEIGWHAYETCSRCDYSTYAEIPATGHSYTAVVTKPTCTEKGYTTHTCHCGDSYVDSYVAALGHSFGEWVTTTKPTCTTVGEERRDCDACDHFETREIKATGHSYNVVVTKPTCTEQGYTTHTCHCGESYVDSYVNALGHSFGAWVVTSEPTCTEKGTERRDCDACDHFETREINATGHSYDAVVTKPTCTEQGYTTHTCHCGESYVDSYVNALGHSFGAWVVTTKPTCTKKGTERRDCDACDHFETREIKATGHSYDAVVTTPTCTSQGYTTHTCHCGDSYVDSYVNALGHTYGAWVVTTKPTCEKVGEERRDCDTCDHFETHEIKALGHDTIKHSAQSATCTKIGWNAYETCSRCDYSTYAEIPATGHNYTAVVTKPTCTSQGYTTHTCHCGDSYVDSYVNALGHSYEAAVTEPTCTEYGFTIYTCHCGDSYVSSYVSALGHSFDEWKTTTEPTCTENGEESRECSICAHVETREIKALGHSYNVVVTDPTCTEHGYTTHTCHCGDSYVDGYVKPLGHAYGDWYQTKAPTENEPGEKRRDCGHCGGFETSPIAELGHDHSRWETIVLEAVAPTCTKTGLTEGSKCSRCGEILVAQEIIHSLGHDFGEWIEIKSATCTEDGTERRECDRCDHFETRTIKASGHSYNAVVTHPTCTEKGYTTHTCQCGDSYVDSYVEAIGHTFGKWREIEEATCEQAGKERRDCDACVHFEMREIEAVGHNYDVVVTNPTCTEQGYTTHTCVCGESYVDSYVDATGHTFGEWAETEAPSCTEAGEERRECTACDHFETRIVEAMGHSYDAVVTKPTCTEQGYTTHTCHCGDSYVDGYVDATGHTFGAWTETQAPTCTEQGSERRACDACDHVETREVVALGHDLITHAAQSATCTEIGWSAYETCSRCDYTTYAEISAKGHEHHCSVTAPTCTEKGYTTHTCSSCGDSYVDAYVDPVGHSLGEWTQAKAPTCVEQGTERRDCDRCDLFEVRELPMTDHVDNDADGTCDTCDQPQNTSGGCRSVLTPSFSSCSMLALVAVCLLATLKKKKE